MGIKKLREILLKIVKPFVFFVFDKKLDDSHQVH